MQLLIEKKWVTIDILFKIYLGMLLNEFRGHFKLAYIKNKISLSIKLLVRKVNIIKRFCNSAIL